MGDSARGEVFSDWLRCHFPPDRFRRVADLAGGKYAPVSKELARLGYNVKLFDVRRGTKGSKRYIRVRKDVEAMKVRPGDFNLIVGMHPDECTWHVIRLAREANAPFAVVPCCIKFPFGKPTPETFGFPQWLWWLRQEATRLGFRVEQTTLPIKGKNILLVGKPTGRTRP
jgi:hypothetical protein